MLMQSARISDRRDEHDGGESGTALEGPLSVTAAGAASLTTAVVFESHHLHQVALRQAARGQQELGEALGQVLDVAEALACAIFRSHVGDAQSIGGSNCTAGGGVFGPASLRINNIINNVRQAFPDSPATVEQKLNEPAVHHVTTDNGLMVSSHDC